MIFECGTSVSNNLLLWANGNGVYAHTLMVMLVNFVGDEVFRIRVCVLEPKPLSLSFGIRIFT